MHISIILFQYIKNFFFVTIYKDNLKQTHANNNNFKGEICF